MLYEVITPMHTWKPDAYGEAPGVVGALLAGGVTSGAFLALMRVYQIAGAAGQGAFASRLLVFMGLFSMATAGIFMINQRDFKRMLAYSSVEHIRITSYNVCYTKLLRSCSSHRDLDPLQSEC